MSWGYNTPIFDDDRHYVDIKYAEEGRYIKREAIFSDDYHPCISDAQWQSLLCGDEVLGDDGAWYKLSEGEHSSYAD